MSVLTKVPTNAILSMSEEDAKYDNVTVTNGSGSASGVYVTVQKGTSAVVNIDFTITTVSESQFNEFKKQVSQTDYARYTNDSSARYETAGSWFSNLFGGVYNASAGVNNNTSQFHATTDDESGFNKMVYNLNTSQFHVTGTLTAVGTSFIPTTVSAYVQVTKFKFADGKELHVINTDSATAATASGDTTGAQSQSSKLTITPL